MGYEMGSTSEGVLEKDDRDEDDEEDYEETPEGSRLFEFMFGNVSGSGDLDIDYLDEDAKEHLAALADKLGSSLAEIDLSVKSSQRSVDAAEQDYDKKAEDAVDYEDIDEQYEGPEIQAVTEEDYLLPKKDYFSAKLSATTSSSVFDDENYDDDYDDEKEFPKENEVGDSTPSVQVPLPGVHGDDLVAVSQGEHSPKDHSGAVDSSEVDSGTLDADFADFQKEELDALEESLEESLEATSSAPLPVLCIEDGVVILRFSEIFAIHEPLKKAEKRDHWYSFPKEKYKAMDISDIVEEDEEEFLKGSTPALSFVKRDFVVSDDLFASKVDEPESENLVVNGSATIVQKVDVWRKDSCNSAEPVIEDISVDFPIEWSIPSCPEYFPLDQQDWESRIIFDTSPAPSENSDMFAPESESLASKETDAASQQKIIQSELEMDVDEKDHGLFLHGLPVSVEQFGSGDVPRSLNLLEDSGFHPQLLRLESRWEIDRSNFSDSRKQDTFESDTMRRFNKLSLRNKDVIEGSWTEKIIWEPQRPVSKPKLILDLQDEQMLFEILDDKDVENLHLHAGAMIIARSVKSSGDSFEQHGHGNQAGGRFNIANDKFYSNRKSSQQLKSHSKKRTTHSIKVLHSVPALKLQTMKTKLSNKDIANFHRPKALWFPHDNGVALREQGKLLTRGPMKIILKSLGGKGSKLHVEAEETISSVKAKATKKLDFKPSEPVKIVYSGKELEDHKSLAEQNVRPNSLLHLVRTKIHLLPKAQKLPGENKSLRPPGAFKKKSDLSAKDGHVFLMEYCEERPLLLGNVGMGVRLCTYYQKLNPGDQNAALLRSGPTGLGNVLTLDPADKSPFLGDIKAGSSQSCLESNMYRAPIYTHKVASTDYLLIRSAKGKLSIRRIDRLDVVGQQEPHMEVMSPASKGVQMYNMNRLLVYMYREFRTFQKRGVVPSIRASELSAQFPYVPEVSLRKRLKHFCDFQRGSWVMRPNFRIPLEEELRRMVTPEHVCAYESMLAGQYRLKRLGISMTHPAGLSSAMNQLPDEAITLAAASHIERELQITPWNLSSNFVACTNQDRGNIERLEITGVGDPSGRGLGFSYVRSTPKAPVPNAMAKKKVPVNRGGSTVTGTDADLRRLSMEAAREVLLKFNVPDEQITKLTRWHRIAMIRKLSSEQASSGLKVDPTTISKYARGQRMSFLQLQQQTREKCQEIWDRQVQNLSAADGEEIDSDTEPNSDLDSFAGDLENLLDAEEGEEGEDGNDECNYDNVIGVKGLKMRRLPSQAQAEEEIEDEAAEAAELCKMLMDDDMADRKKKKKAKSVGEEMKSAHVPQLVHSLKNKEWTKTSNTVSKPVTVIPQHDVAYSSKEIVKQSKEEEIFASKKHFSGKLKPKKKENVESVGLLNKKIKILGDGIKVIKEKKSARESFVCGACGQLGHMRTNKHCPRYREDVDVQVESRDAEKVPGKSIPTDLIAKPQQKATVKKLIPKVGPKIAAVEIPEDEKSGPKAKVLKVKCGSSDLHQEKVTPANSQLSDRLVTSDTETVNISSVKVNKIIFSKKTKPEDVQVEPYKPSIVIRPPAETNINQPRKKIIIKQPKEVHELDQVIQDGYTGIEFTKTRRINELSGFPNRRGQDREHYEDKVRVRERTGKRSWEEEQKRRFAPRHREERANMLYEEHSRNLEGNVDAIRKYQESLKMEREEEKRQREKKKKTKNKPFEMRGEFFDDFHPRRNDRRILERERTTKRKHVVELSGRYGAEYAPPVKRRRGGEVALANILEKIVDTLKDNPVSYLFLKPVSKKEAPDYLDIIERPMDLSKIKDNVRKFQYKCREDFRHDVWQITYNAHKYNDGKNPGIPPLGDQLLELCDFLLSEYHESLSEAEDDIEDD